MQPNPLMVILDLDGDGWRIGIFILLAASSVFFIFKNYLKRIGFALSALWSHAAVSGLFITSLPGLKFGVFQNAFAATAGDTLMALFLVPAAALSIPAAYLSRAMLILPVLAIIENLALWFRGFGLMLSPSFDTALLALVVPFCPWWLSVASIITIVTRHGSTAVMILLAQLLALSIKDKKILPFGLIIGGGLFFAAWVNSGHLFNGGERLEYFERFMGAWWSQSWLSLVPMAEGHSVWLDRIVGIGPGSFNWISFLISDFKPPMFFQMHSDWLQVVFELGIVGIALVIAGLYKITKASWNDPQSLCAIFGLMAFCLTYHPLRFAPTMLCTVLILRRALSCK